MDASAVSSQSNAVNQSMNQLNATVLQPAANANSINVAVMKKANDAQASAALSLLQALPPVPQYNNPSNLGNSVDVKA
ncbi:putative motility protein [Silvimonas iriomotensis]|uniref:Motility protein n=1 Tax=Silvimonas iriomotensis TaxID=449662 RepID=A0ABQ2P733_9NEIS|nr:putative motility protein [Silvimonas iriomotensis]GGP19313.1 hypothetical protein GCM10010970_09990 [Silvimonas iriomotensis]